METGERRIEAEERRKKITYLARVSVWFWSKQDRGSGFFAFGYGL